MTNMLSWDKPKKVRSTKEHNDLFSSEAPAAGTYVPNMSKEDRLKWKAKHIKKGKDPRVEIRKTAIGTCRTDSQYATYCQMLLVVRPDGSVVISGNGKADVSIIELNNALREAMEVFE